MSGELILDQRHGESCGIDVPLEPSDWGELVQAHLVR